jgi:hypothetical protein
MLTCYAKGVAPGVMCWIQPARQPAASDAERLHQAPEKRHLEAGSPDRSTPR